MNARHSASTAPRKWAYALMGVLSGLAGGCGEDAKPIGDACENVPLYRLSYDEATKQWVRVTADGGALSADDNQRVDDEENRSGARCLTPLGTATTTSPGGGTSTGGAGGSSDAGGTGGTGGGTSTGGASGIRDAGVTDSSTTDSGGTTDAG